MAWAVDVRAEERTTVYSAFFALVGMTGAHTLLETARDALFLAKVPASRLVWVYAMFAVIAIIVARVGMRPAKDAGQKNRVAPGLIGGACVTLGFWIVMSASHSTPLWMLYALYLWPGVFGAWIIGTLWSAIGAVLTVAQAKRLFGFVGAGAVLGALLGAGLSRVMTSSLAPEQLLLAGALLFLVTGIGPGRSLDKVTGSGVALPPRRAVAQPASASFSGDLRTLLAAPYEKRVLLLVFLASIALTAGDFLFKSTVAAHVPAARLGSFFATVSIALNTLALLTQLVGVRFLLRSLGVNRALAIMPFLLLGGALGVASVPVLAAALFVRGVDGTLRHSLHKTTSELLFVPISNGPAKSLVDLIGQRGGQLVASLALLPLFAFGGERALGVAIACLAGAWLVVAVTLKKPYLDLFRETLREGRIDDAGVLPQLDLSSLEALFGALNSQKDPEVLGALDLLAAQERAHLLPALVLYHPSKPIVLRALDVLTAEKRRDFVPIADRLLAQHPDAEVRAACLRARTAVSPDEAFLRKLLESGSPDVTEAPGAEVRATALAALVGHRLLVGEAAEREIATLMSGPRTVRCALARATAFEPSRVFEDALVTLAEDPDAEVRLEATRALGRVASPRFIPLLASMLDGRREAAAAREALAEIGAPALAALSATLGDHGAARELRWGVARALGHWRDPESAAAILVKNLPAASGDGMLQTRMARALNRLRRAEPKLRIDDASITRECEAAARDAFDDLAHRLAIESLVPKDDPRRTPTFELLTSMLKDGEANAISRMCSLLGLIHPQESFSRIERGLRSRSAKTRASSRELIEHIVVPPLRESVLLLVDDAPDAMRLERAEELPQTGVTKRASHALATDLPATMRSLTSRKGETQTVASFFAAEAGLFAVDEAAADGLVLDPALGAALAARANDHAVSRRGTDV